MRFEAISSSFFLVFKHVLFCLRGPRLSPHHGLLEVIGFDAADEIWLACSQRFHQGIQGLAELTAQCWHTLLAIWYLLLIQIKCKYV